MATTTIANGENASYVLGQTNFTSSTATTTQSGLNYPQGITYDASSSRLFVADYNNSRVMVFPAPTSTNLTGENASVVIGEPDFVTNTGGTNATTTQNPTGVAYDPLLSRLFVADNGNNRVMVFLNAASGTLANGAAASFFLGQTNATNSSGISSATANNMYPPTGVAFDPAGNQLFVADTQHNRVMDFNAASGTLATDEAASFFLGQATSTGRASVATQNGLNSPSDISYDPGTQNLYVADARNNRIMVFSAGTSTIATGENASYNFGHTDINANPEYTGSDTNNFPQPNEAYNVHGTTLDAKNHRLFVADYSEVNPTARVLVYQLDANNNITTGTASYVLGWPSFYTNFGGNGASSTFLSNENKGGAYDPVNDRYFVADQGGNRVLVFNVATSTIANGEYVSYVLGQANFTSSTATTTQSGLTAPSGLAYDSADARLFVNDAGNNRILVFNVATTTIANGENASYVIGQAGFTTSMATTTQSGLNEKEASAAWTANMDYDPVNARLFVPDVGDNRVMVFSAPTSTNLTGENASYVFGQTSWTQSASSTTQSGLNSPMTATYDPVNSRLFIGDKGNQRVLVFDASTSTLSVNGNGENAEAVIGQSSFTSTNNTNYAQNGSGGSESGAYDPVNNRYFDGQYFPDRVMEDSFIHITTPSLASGTVSSAYSQPISVTSTQGTSQSYSVYSGSLPSGLSLSSSTGVIAGTPTVATTTSVVVEADDIFSTGPFFDRATYTIQTTAVTSTAPQSLAAAPASQQISLSWSAPASTGGVPITQYLVYDRTTGSSTFSLYATTTQTTQTIPSLTNGQSYDFEVIAENSVGTSTASSIISAIPAVPPPPTPGGGGAGSPGTTPGGVPILAIEGDATSTASSSVFLTITIPYPALMQVSNDASFPDSSSIPAAGSLSWNLCTGLASCLPGMHTVYLKVTSLGGIAQTVSQSIDYEPAGTANPVSVTAASTTPVIASSTPASSSLPSSNAIVEELQILLAKLKSLQAQAGITPASGTALPASSTLSSYPFTRNLSLWDEGKDVTALQEFLIQNNAGTKARLLKSHGTSTTFAYLTLHALQEYQASVGLPATGYFGPLTRKKMGGE